MGPPLDGLRGSYARAPCAANAVVRVLRFHSHEDDDGHAGRTGTGKRGGRGGRSTPAGVEPNRRLKEGGAAGGCARNLHLGEFRSKREVRTTVAGIVVTPRLREKAGGYIREGDLICVVEDPSRQQAEIALEEEKVRGIEPGQSVRFKARALPFENLEGRVTGIAPCAAREDTRAQGTVIVHCSMDGALPVLRTSMSGYARIYTGRRSLGGILLNRAMRLFRTEFWW